MPHLPRPVILLALLGSPALGQAAPSPAAPPAAGPNLSQAAFDPAPYLAATRWADGCYGVSFNEPADMIRTTPPGLAPARWNFKRGQVEYNLRAEFVLPVARNDGQQPRPLSFQGAASAIFANLAAGQGTFVPLPAFTRDFIADKHPCTVYYGLLQPEMVVRPDQPMPDSFLVGAGVMQVNPRCHLALILVCRIPAGAREWPALIDGQRKLEAALGSARAVPEGVLIALREAQLNRGEKFLQSLTLARTQMALDAFGHSTLLRVVQDGEDAGWARWTMRHQDARWYQAHKGKETDVDALHQTGLKTVLQIHTESAGNAVDMAQTCFHSDQSIYDAWQRTTTWRADAGKAAPGQSTAPLAPQTAAETGYFTRPPGFGETAQLKVEWAGSPPSTLVHFFNTNRDWRKQLGNSKLWNALPGSSPAPPGRPLQPRTDDGKHMDGDLTQKKWAVPLDPRRPYLSQAQAWLMPWLLPADTAQSYAFCFYSQDAKRPGICLFKVTPHADGARTVVFRPGLDQAEQSFELDAQSRLLRASPAPGLQLIPASTEEMARIWHVGEEK